MARIHSGSLPEKLFVGNGIRINREENNMNLTVTGNACDIEIGKNNGILNIIGNAHCVTVHSGRGYVKITGNNILVQIGPDFDEENVTWSGNNIRIVKTGTRKASYSHHDVFTFGKDKTIMEPCFRMKECSSAPVHEPEIVENKLHPTTSKFGKDNVELFSQMKTIPTPSASKFERFENMESSCQMKMTPSAPPAPYKDELSPSPTSSDIKRETHEQHALFMPD